MSEVSEEQAWESEVSLHRNPAGNHMEPPHATMLRSQYKAQGMRQEAFAACAVIEQRHTLFGAAHSF